MLPWGEHKNIIKSDEEDNNDDNSETIDLKNCSLEGGQEAPDWVLHPELFADTNAINL